MAQRTRTFKFGGGDVLWVYEYEDGDGSGLGALVRVRCVNSSQWPTRATLTVLANGRSFTRRVLPGDQLNVAVPTAGAQRLDIGVDAKGRIGGIDHRYEWGPGV